MPRAAKTGTGPWAAVPGILGMEINRIHLPVMAVQALAERPSRIQHSRFDERAGSCSRPWRLRRNWAREASSCALQLSTTPFSHTAAGRVLCERCRWMWRGQLRTGACARIGILSGDAYIVLGISSAERCAWVWLCTTACARALAVSMYLLFLHVSFTSIAEFLVSRH